MAAVPLWPSLVAVIVAEPATFAVTSPVPVTVATGVLLLAHVTARPVRMLPLASRRVAVSCTVCPAGTLADAGLTVTDATGTPLTVMLAVPLWPSLVAVMVTAPATTPVTSPLLLTVAIVLSLDDQLIARPVKGLPLASRGVAVSCTVCPIATVPELGVTVTAATGATVTVTVAVPLCPSLVAVIVTGPPAATPLTSPLPFTLAIALLLDCQVTTRPVNGLPFASLGVAVPLWPSLVAVIVAEPATLVVTSPLLLTVATVVLFEAHVTVRPVKTLPFASLRVAVSCTVWPAGTLAEGGVTVTEATGAPATVMLAVPLWPSLVAVMVTDPAVTPVTSPLPLTVAMLLLLDDQLMARPVNGLPLASRGVAVSCTVCPCSTLTEAGVTVTAATGTVGTIFAR